MSWMRQVAHVALKDLRCFWWLLAALVAALGMAISESMQRWPTADTRWLATVLYSFGVGGIGYLTLLSICVAAVLVQADSPSRADAFWATRPLDRLAVACAKAILIGSFVVALPGLAEAAVLMVHGVSGARMWTMLAYSVLVHASVVAVAVLLAALTRDFKSFVVTLMGAWFIWRLAVLSVALRVDGIPQDAGAVHTLLRSGVWALGGAAIAAYVYHTRRLRRAWSGVAVLVAAYLLLLPFVPFGSLGRLAGGGEVPDTARATDLALGGVSAVPRRGSTRGTLPGPGHWSVWADLDLKGRMPGYRYQFTDVRARLRLSDGRASTHRSSTSGTTHGPFQPPPEGLRWLEGSDPQGVRPSARLELLVLDPEELARLEQDGAHLEITARVRVLRERTLADLPLRAGGAVAAGDDAFHLLRVRDGGEALRLEGATQRVRAPWEWAAPRGDDFLYALVNRARGDAVALLDGGGSTGERALVLPGASVVSTTDELVPAFPWLDAQDSTDIAAWLDGAELSVIKPVPLGSYEVSLVVDDFHVEAAREWSTNYQAQSSVTRR